MAKILIAEDNVSLRQLMKIHLKRAGYTVYEAADGSDALEVMDHNHVDLIIADIMMPVMDGYQALMGIRNLEMERNIPKEKQAKIIMTTALNDEKNVKMAFDLGCTVYSGKPIDQDKFELVLKKFGLY